MSSPCSEIIDSNNGKPNTEAQKAEAPASTKLERRRRIEDLFEERRLRQELGDFDMQ